MLKAIATTLLAAFVLTACNTMQGLGRDVERGGEKLQGTAAEQQRR